MRRLQIASNAQRDIGRLLADSKNRFGPMAAHRYRALLSQAFQQLRVVATPPSAGPRDFAPDSLYFFHLSGVRMPEGAGRVARPRHFVVYEFDDSRVRIVRVLYDAMNLPGLFEPEL